MAQDSARDEEALHWRLFASYSPAEVVLRYADLADPKPPEVPEQQDFDAAIGFVDVSGFTALSEKLNKDHGRKGAELLNQCALPSPRCATLARRTFSWESAPKSRRYRSSPRASVRRGARCGTQVH